MDPAFILSLVYGHLFSKGVDSAMAVSKRHISEKEFSEILNDFDQKFKNDYDAEITLCECDMQSVIEKRTLLIPLAEKYINQDNADISRNLKQSFVNTACREIFGHENWKKEKSSKVVEKYMEFFYDLVFMKEISGIPAGYRALLNAYIDNQHDINEDLYRRILALEITIRKIQKVTAEPVDFRSYYKEVERRFTEDKEEGYKNLVGDESDEKAYIEAFITNGNEQVPVLSYLDEWFDSKNYGSILIYGEPGHGKTILCDKASVDFSRGHFLKGKAKNVISVSLNTGDNRSIIEGKTVTLSNSLVWGAEKEKKFSFEDCRGALLFMDGFDEFIDEAKQADTGIDNICSFMKRVNGIAKSRGLHIVILSRTIAVSQHLAELSTSGYKHFELSPVSEKQQDEWMERHVQYSDYKDVFQNLREDTNMQRLLGVPLLFRLIVHNRFNKASSNVVELYDNLFSHLMFKRDIFDEERRLVSKGLMDLAFEVYCTDTNIAFLNSIDWDTRWVFAFYVKTSDKGKIGFFHRTFYQYFLAKYIYFGIVDITAKNESVTQDEKVENFIGQFAERELDGTVREYLSLVHGKEQEDKFKVFDNINRLIKVLISTEGIIINTPHVDSGDAERSRFLRLTNIYRNTMHIAAAFSYTIRIPFKGNIDFLVRAFNSKGIMLKKVDLRGANLIGASLSGADLSGASLARANMDRTNLRGASLREANLSRAELVRADLCRAKMSDTNLSGADLHEANLREAHLLRANLNGANLCETNLSEADLANADLNGAYMVRAYLSGTDLSKANLRGADLSRASLIGACLREADLREADLIGTDLREADFSGANLDEADLSEAILDGARIDIKNKGIISSSVLGYDYIKWISTEDD